MRKREWVAGLVVFAVVAAGVAVWRSRPPAPRNEKAVADNQYVDSALCARCHTNIRETYLHTGMGRSFSRPSPENTLSPGGKPATFYHQPSDSYFTNSQRDGRFYQRRYQMGPDHRETNILEKPIDFVVGSGNHVRAYLYRTSRNTLVELPLAWYAENGGTWAMNPGYERPDHPGFRREVTYGCMFCHNGYPDIPASGEASGAEPVFTRVPEGIDCQRCHGPGGRHVQVAQTAGARPEQIRAAIVNPTRLSPERQSEVCLQCHLETTSFRLPNSVLRYDRGPFSYRPGEPLADFMLHFDEAPGQGRDDKFEIAGAAYRLRLSACFRRSDGALRCTTCHDPHNIPRGEQAAQHYAKACRQCHASPFDQLVASRRHPPGQDCAGCHMPKRRTDDVVHVVMTDHYIQRRRPARDLLGRLPVRRETDATAYHGPVVPYYPATLTGAPEGELYLAVAQVSQKSNLKDGIPRLAGAIEKYHPARMEFYLQLADAWKDYGQLDKALPLYEEAVRRAPQSPVALEKFGFSLRAAGQAARAAEVLKRALAVNAGDAPAWHQLGLVYLDQGARSEAVVAFQKAIEVDPDLPEAQNSLGGVWLESGDLARAEPAFREAIRLQPDYAEAHSNLATVLASSGRFDEARSHFETALHWKPDYAAARYNYAIALARERRFGEAQRQIEASLQADPKSAEAHDLLGNLLVNQGKLAAGVAQFREAITLRPEFARAHLDLGEALADAGDVSGALPHLRQASQASQPALREEALQALRSLNAAGR